MQEKSQRKRNQHFVPKLYLKGFTEADTSPFLWVFTKGKPYNPGDKGHHNPRKRSVRRVGVERDHYAFRKRDGTVDLDTYEDELEKQEKPSNPVLEKLRRGEMIEDQEKVVFASYVYLMYKRVPKRRERFTKSWPRVFQSVSSRMAEWFDIEEAVTYGADSTRPARISKLRSESEGVLEYYREHGPIDSEIPLKSLVMESPLACFRHRTDV